MNFYTRFLLFLISTVFLASCSNLTVQKRLYRPGYYVDWNQNQQAKKALDVPTENQSAQMDGIATEAPKDEVAIENIGQPETMTSTTMDSVSAKAEFKKSIRKSDKIKSDNIKSGKGAGVNENRSLFPHISNAHNLIEANSSLAGQSDGEGIGSLLWLIVVVLLILWLLGIVVANLGGIIYILLVVALVLLLLRILSVL